MAENTIKVRQKQRYDTEANWKSKNPVLLAGEIAISSDKTGLMKVGDGKSLWTAIPYSKASLSKTDVTTALGYTPPTTNTTYSIGTSSTAGIVKLYTGTGSNTDGSMTQAAIKSALDGKSGTGHTHNYAGSGSAGGSANSAVKLDTATAGSTTQPVYFSGGKPAVCTYTLGKSVPSNAVFTDTWRGIQNNLASDSATDSLAAAQGKALKSLITDLSSKSFQKKTDTIINTTDWNTIKDPGCYKVQVVTWGDATKLHSPNAYLSNLYQYGLLLVFRATDADTELRTVQIFMPHRSDSSNPVLTRMLNGSTWNAWSTIGRGIKWSEINGKPSTFTPSSHTHDDRYYTETEIDTKLKGKSGTDHKHDLSTMINTLSTGAAVPTDADYFVSQYVGGGTTTTSYHRRPVSALWSYIKAKTDGLYQTKGNYAAASHKHGNADITNIDASKISSGTIDLARLPQGALERCVIVADETARLKLTTATVQKGDTVKVTATNKMYFVIDDTKLNTEAGYTVYTAGTATSVPWSGVTGKPSTYPPSEHTHDINALINTLGIGTATPTDTDYYICQTAGGGTSDLTYARRSTSSMWNYIKGKADTIYQPKGSYATSDHTHTYIIDCGNNASKTTLAYSKAGLGYSEYTWLAAWNGYELRAVNKNQFATSGHTHSQYYDSTISRTTNTVLAAPNGSNGGATFRALMEEDLPRHNNPYYWEFIGTSGQDGYIKIMTIKPTVAYQNQPMTFLFGQRGVVSVCRLSIEFTNAGSASTTEVNSFTVAGAGMNFYIVKSSAGVFDVYVKKIDKYDSIVLYGYWKSSFMDSTTITFSDTQITSVPSGYVQAGWGETVNRSAVSNRTDNSIIVQLNGGSTEGTNKFTFNGSAAKTINITPSAIGASAVGHSHGVLEDPTKSGANTTNFVSLSYYAKELDDSTSDYVAVWNKKGNQIGTQSKSAFVLASRTYNVTSGTIYLPWDDTSARAKLPTIETLTRWNGAYDKNGGSVLAYCNQGAFANGATCNITYGTSAPTGSGKKGDIYIQIS